MAKNECDVQKPPRPYSMNARKEYLLEQFVELLAESEDDELYNALECIFRELSIKRRRF